MKNIVVIGCNGYLGKKIVLHFLKQNQCHIYGLDLKPSKLNHPNFTFILANKLENIKLNCKVNVLYQTAWCGVDTEYKNNCTIQNKNISTNKSILKFVKNNGMDKIIYFGSMSEFSGYSNKIKGNEQRRPSDVYSATKSKIFETTSLFCKKNSIKLIYLLITSIFSKDRKTNNLIYYAINRLKQSKPIRCTKLEQKWDYIYIDDLIRVIVLITENINKSDIIPIGSGEVHTLKFYVMTIAKILGKTNLVKIGALPYKNNFIDNSLPNIIKIKKLGFRPEHKFNYYIKSMIQDNN